MRSTFILERHPALKKLRRHDCAHAAILRATCRVVTVLDYPKGFGQADVVTVRPGAPAGMEPARADDWGFLGRASE